MSGKILYYNTITPLLREILNELMVNSLFEPFCLVGGTSLSLRLGHRMSIDIDLFTNVPYGSLDFSVFEQFFKENYHYFDKADTTNIVGFGRSYYVGNSAEEHVKVDLYYKDEITDAYDVIDNIRMASLPDVVAMKVDVIQYGGRKKDFWDLHKLLETYSIEEMITFHEQRYEYTHDRTQIIENFTNFTKANRSIDPHCLENKTWEWIKLDFVEKITPSKHQNQ